MKYLLLSLLWLAVGCGYKKDPTFVMPPQYSLWCDKNTQEYIVADGTPGFALFLSKLSTGLTFLMADYDQILRFKDSSEAKGALKEYLEQEQERRARRNELFRNKVETFKPCE